jgi:hypothetical protein
MKCDVSFVSAASLKLNDLLVDLSHFFQNLDRFTSLVTFSTTGRRTDNVVLLEGYHACYPIVSQRSTMLNAAALPRSHRVPPGGHVAVSGLSERISYIEGPISSIQDPYDAMHEAKTT